MKLKCFVASILLMLMTNSVLGQFRLSLKILDEHTQGPLIGATVYVSDTQGAIANDEGVATLTGITQSSIEIRVSFVGYVTQTRTFTLPISGESPVVILMEPEHGEMEEVIVTSTRSTRSIEDIPTRIEFLGAEELEEKAAMRSDNIAMLLRESTGIQMQITSPSSANQSIRIQGLDGRYTQLLKDGFPLYSGFSGGLSIMQIPPLDLRQVEVIKGSNSTLYGGGAIAGLVNLVSIQPDFEANSKVMFDVTSAGGQTLNTFYAKRGAKFGMTLFLSANNQGAFDPNEDNFSDIPDTRRLTINPTLFYYPSDDSQIRLSLQGTFEDRLGGNLTAIDRETGSANEFVQENLTNRISYQLSYEKNWDAQRSLTIKNSLVNFDREINQFNHSFDGEQWTSFSEVSYGFGNQRSSWNTGFNVYTDRFNEGALRLEDRSYDQTTVGAFVQQIQTLSDRFSIESGLRIDKSDIYGWFVLPRVALFYKPNPKFSYRLGGGLGYKTPTIFTEDTERLAFRGLSALNLDNLDAEKSYGGNFDINYKTALGDDWTFSINQLFFYTRLSNPLVLRENNNNTFLFENADGPVRSSGLETNIKLTYQDFKLFFNYALIDTELQYDNINNQKPLTAKHNIGAVLVYEQHGKWRLGLESYYTGSQLRNNGSETRDFWIVGFMALRKFKGWSLYVNFENFVDARQSRFETINLGSSMNPELLDVWAPLEGAVVNGGIILEF